jgi:hypothetical protein
MWNHRIQPKGLTGSNLVAAVFLKTVLVRDAIADLKLAGFHASDIGVALSKQGQLEHERNPEAVPTPADLGGKHSFTWKVRHSLAHDVHHSHGSGLSSQQDAAAADEEYPPYTEFDLTETLRQLGVGEDTVQLLNREVGKDGIFLLVNARDRCHEAERILERNGGYLRSVMVTEWGRPSGSLKER